MKALQSYEDNIRKLKELLQDSANIDELSEKLEIVEQNFKNTLAKMGMGGLLIFMTNDGKLARFGTKRILFF